MLSVCGKAECPDPTAWLALCCLEASHEGERRWTLKLWRRDSFMSPPTCLVLLWVLVR